MLSPIKKVVRLERLKVLFSQRNYMLLWTSQLVSTLGDSVWIIAVAWQVLALTNSAQDLSTVLLAYSVPQLIFLILGGMTIDRMPRRNIMIALDGLRAIVVLSVAILDMVGMLNVFYLCLVSGFLGIGSAIYNPAFKSLIPEVIEHKEWLLQANALLSFSGSVRRIVGPALGGLVVATAGISGGVIIDAISFAIAMILVLRLPLYMGAPAVASTNNENSRVKTYWHNLLDGLTAVTAYPWIRTTIIFSTVISLVLFGPLLVGLPVAINAAFADATTLGLVLAGEGISAVIGSALLTQYDNLQSRGLFAYAGIALAGSGLIGYALMVTLQSALIGIIASLAVGLGTVMFNIVWDTTLQDIVPSKMLGRVITLDYLISSALLPLSYLASGWIITQLPITSVLVFAGVITISLSGSFMLTKAVRGMN